jgi:hypothetical protein
VSLEIPDPAGEQRSIEHFLIISALAAAAVPATSQARFHLSAPAGAFN